MRKLTEKVHSISIDVETDWGGRASTGHDAISGCQYTIPKLLEAFSRYGIKATFFIVGELIPFIKYELKMINDSGHEIASHGQNHNIRYDKLTREELTYQVRTSKKQLEDFIGKEVYGFRSPQFRINSDLFELLEKEGYQYDSSYVAGKLKGRYQNKIPAEPFWCD